MKQIILDFSKDGAVKGILHFIKGALLYAAIGAVGYVTTRYANWHPGTTTEILLYTGAGEAIQALSKWLTTQKEAEEVVTQEII